MTLRTALIACLVALFSSAASAQPLASYATLAAGGTADVWSTRRVLQCGASRELNPLLGSHPSDARLVATKAAGALLVVLVMRKLEALGHRKLAAGLGYGVGGGWGLVAAHNAAQRCG